VWDKAKRYEGFEWKGYTLDAKRSPTFRYTWQEAEIEETFTTEGNGNKPDGNAKLIRTVKINGKLPANAWYRLGTGMFETKTASSPSKAPSYRITAQGAQIAGPTSSSPPNPAR
jgi:hypothetical protein